MKLNSLVITGEEDHILYMQTESGHITYISPSGAAYFALDSEQIIGMREVELFSEQIAFDLMEIDQRVLITGRPHHYQITQQGNPHQETITVTKYLVQTADESAPQLVSILQVQQNAPIEKTEPRIAPLNPQFLALQSAITAVSNSLDLDLITETFTWEMAHLLQAAACAYYLWQEDQNQFLLQNVYDPQHAISFPEILTKKAHPFLRHAIEERTVYQINQKTAVKDDETHYLNTINVGTMLYVPLCTQGRLIGLGVVCLADNSYEFAVSETAVAQLLADQTASTIFNAQLYTELLKTNERLIESNGDLQAFAHTTAHDLKTPVGSIIGFAELLVQEQNSFSPAEASEFLHIILRSSHQMRTIIDNLLLLASVRQKDMPIAPVDMSTVMPEVLTRLAYLIKQSNCEFSMPDKWPMCLGDTHWLQEVWANYMSNAIKYGGTPPIIKLGATPLDNGKVRFWVKDNGKGLSTTEQEQLFIPFSRIQQKGEKKQGHGLGLSIVQRIVHKLGGSVGVDSTVGEGSTFYFELPQLSSNR